MFINGLYYLMYEGNLGKEDLIAISETLEKVVLLQENIVIDILEHDEILVNGVTVLAEFAEKLIPYKKKFVLVIRDEKTRKLLLKSKFTKYITFVSSADEGIAFCTNRKS